MDWVLALKAVVMGIVEGLTEFLPISSTGHLIITGDILNFLAKEQRDVFEIFIQLGAIVAVCWEYRTRLIRVVSGLPGDAQARRFTVNLVIAFIPAAVVGLALSKTIKTYLFAPVPVATAFAVVLADHVVGTVNLEIDPVHGVAMLGYGLARAHWGRGLATEAAAAVVAWTFATHELIAIWASTHADNLRSQRVLAKLGMTPDPATGTERRYWLRRPAASRAAR